MPKGQAGVIVNSESIWKKMIGKTYSEKLNVRFDERELETWYGCDTVTLVNKMANTTYSHCTCSLPTFLQGSTFLFERIVKV